MIVMHEDDHDLDDDENDQVSSIIRSITIPGYPSFIRGHIPYDYDEDNCDDDDNSIKECFYSRLSKPYQMTSLAISPTGRANSPDYFRWS